MAVEGICGGDPRRIEQTLGLADYEQAQLQWAQCPPMRFLLAAQVGFKPKGKRKNFRDLIEDKFGGLPEAGTKIDLK